MTGRAFEVDIHTCTVARYGIEWGMAKKELVVTKEQAGILCEALQGKIDELSKIATTLMKRGLQDAAAPVYAKIKQIQEDVSVIEDGIKSE